MNIRLVGVKLLHAERRTDITKLIVVFAILRKRLKISNFRVPLKFFLFFKFTLSFSMAQQSVSQLGRQIVEFLNHTHN